MIGLTYTIQEDLRQRESFRRRGFNAIVKRTLKGLLIRWHRRFLERHFTRHAYRLYRHLGLYRKQKRTGDPMVDKGDLRRRMLRRRTASDVTGTAKGVTLRLPIGRPGKYTEAALKRQVFIRMRKDRIGFRAAQSRVYRGAQYSKDARRMFHTHIPVAHGSEARHLRALGRDRIVAEMNRRGPKRRRTIKV